MGGRVSSRCWAGSSDLVRIRNTHGYTGKIVALPCDGSPDCLRATLHRWEESPMMAFDSQGIALILLVAVLSLVVGGAALWIELR